MNFQCVTYKAACHQPSPGGDRRPDKATPETARHAEAITEKTSENGSPAPQLKRIIAAMVKSTDVAPTLLPPGRRLPLLVAFLPNRTSRFLTTCQQRYGDVFSLTLPTRSQVYLTDPADIKTVFAGDPSVFHAGEANKLLLGILGSSSLLLVDDEVHRDRRRLMAPPFHRLAVAQQAELIAEITAKNVAEWPVGTQFAVAPRISEITLEVILRTVIGATEPARLAALREVMPRLLKVGAWDLMAIVNPALIRRFPWRGLRRRIAAADALLYAEIADRRVDPHLPERTDTLAKLLRSVSQDGTTMSNQELRDQLMTLLVAGHDTTAAAISWALERLTRHPVVLAEAVRAAEASSAGDAAADDYLDAVLKETLRSRPVLTGVSRVLTEPTEIAGYRLEAGVTVVASIALVHANAAHYPDPDRFDPKRMFGTYISPTTWLPFGGGNRRCLGASFAMTEMRVVLREILRRVELTTTTAAGEPIKIKHVIQVPGHDALVTIASVKDAPVQASTG